MVPVRSYVERRARRADEPIADGPRVIAGQKGTVAVVYYGERDL